MKCASSITSRICIQNHTIPDTTSPRFRKRRSGFYEGKTTIFEFAFVIARMTRKDYKLFEEFTQRQGLGLSLKFWLACVKYGNLKQTRKKSKANMILHTFLVDETVPLSSPVMSRTIHQLSAHYPDQEALQEAKDLIQSRLLRCYSVYQFERL